MSLKLNISYKGSKLYTLQEHNYAFCETTLGSVMFHDSNFWAAQWKQLVSKLYLSYNWNAQCFYLLIFWIIETYVIYFYQK